MPAERSTILRKLADRPFKDVIGEVPWALSGLEAAYGYRHHFSELLTSAA